MKNGDLKQIIERFDRLESKMDKVLEEKLPTLETKVALIEERTSRAAKATAAVGGVITLAVSTAVAYFKRT